jgi:hypothetical protein
MKPVQEESHAMRSALVGLIVGALFTLAPADVFAQMTGPPTVATWRLLATLGGEQWARGSAFGASLMLDGFVTCTKTVNLPESEIVTFLRHEADPAWTIEHALITKLLRASRGGCRMKEQSKTIEAPSR